MGKIYRAKNDVAIDELRGVLNDEGFTKVNPVGKIWNESYKLDDCVGSPEVNINTTDRKVAIICMQDDDNICKFLSSHSDFVSPRLKLG